MKITTWNMQGGNASTEVKWQTGVLNMMGSAERWKPDVLCLQECGAWPSSATRVNSVQVAGQGGRVPRIDLYAFGGSRSRPGHYITYYEWDIAGGRVNMAIVSRGAQPTAADVKLVWVAGGPSWRPVLGVRQIIAGPDYP